MSRSVSVTKLRIAATSCRLKVVDLECMHRNCRSPHDVDLLGAQQEQSYLPAFQCSVFAPLKQI